MKDKISIIVATKNCVHCVGKALMSIKRQNCIEKEVIIIDGNSCDGTIDLAQNILPQALVLCEDDNGIYEALNKGLKLATGDWIYVLGADDEIIGDSILSELMNLGSYDTDLVYGDIIAKKDGKNRYLKMHSKEEWMRRGIKCPPIFHQAMILRRRALGDVEYFDTTYKSHADYMMFSRYYLKGNVKYLEKPIAIYSQEGFTKISLRNCIISFTEMREINLRLGVNAKWLYIALLKNLLHAISGF